MTQVEITYNPFLQEEGEVAVEVSINGSKLEKNADILKVFKDIKDGKWADRLLDELKGLCIDTECSIDFGGLVRDYESLEDAKARYDEQNKTKKPQKQIIFTLKGREHCIYAERRLEELKEVFDWIYETFPFEKQDTKESFKTHFDSVLSNNFEIAVVATMSSGKSTLINALLGTELLPARNEATTAAITKIFDKYEEDSDTESKRISAVVKNAGDKVIEKIENFSAEDMDRLNTAANKAENESEEACKNRPSTIEISAHIPGIHSSKNMRLVLTDTPGPNSESSQHKEHTYNLLKDKENKPIILYILNAEQFTTDDDNSFLQDVREAMSEGGRQSQDRFLFVLNKADDIDFEKDGSPKDFIASAKDYLQDYGITNPHIFLLSAQMAKVLRQYCNKEDISSIEKTNLLSQYNLFNEESDYHFEQYADLSPHCKEQQEKMLQAAQDNPYQQALIHTGIVSIELAITEYLQKYALPTKISEGVASFKEKLDNLKLEAEETEKLKDNEARVEEYSQHIATIEKALQNGEKAGRLREEIENFSSKEDAKNILDERSNEFFANINTELDKFSGEQDKEGVEKSLVVLKKCFEESSSRLKVALEDFLTSHIKNQVESYVAEYTNYVQGLFDNGLELTLNLNTSAGILGDLAEINSIEILNKYKEEKVVGSYEVSTSIWYKPWTWWDTKTIYKYGEKVDCDKVKKEVFLPPLQDFVHRNRKAALKEAKKQEKELKEFFLGEFEKLDNKIKDKIAEKRDMLSSKEKLEAALEKNKNNLAWLKKVRDKLEQILSIKK